MEAAEGEMMEGTEGKEVRNEATNIRAKEPTATVASTCLRAAWSAMAERNGKKVLNALLIVAS